jgi:hypothetical protein
MHLKILGCFCLLTFFPDFILSASTDLTFFKGFGPWGQIRVMTIDYASVTIGLSFLQAVAAKWEIGTRTIKRFTYNDCFQNSYMNLSFLEFICIMKIIEIVVLLL